MPVELPVEIVYYFEISPIGDMLIYCIPSAELRTMQKEKKVNEGIVKDYPGGVDIKVTSEVLEKFKINYNLQLDIDPYSLSNAFQFLKYKSGKGFPKTGFIKKKFLEDLAQHLKLNLIERKINFKSQFEKVHVNKLKEKKILLKNRRKGENAVKAEFQKIKYAPFDSQVSLANRDFLNVKMGEGDKAFDFFSKMQHRTERRK